MTLFSRLKIVALVLPIGGLAGCDMAQPDQKATAMAVTREGDTRVITSSSGASVTMQSSADAPIDPASLATVLPAFAPVYPGATVRAQIASNGPQSDGRGAMVVLTTADPVAKVAAFYDSQAKKAGVSATMVANDPDGAVRVFGNERSNSGAMVAIGRDEESAATEIVIASGKADMREAESPGKVWGYPPVRLQ